MDGDTPRALPRGKRTQFTHKAKSVKHKTEQHKPGNSSVYISAHWTRLKRMNKVSLRLFHDKLQIKVTCSYEKNILAILIPSNDLPPIVTPTTYSMRSLSLSPQYQLLSPNLLSSQSLPLCFFQMTKVFVGHILTSPLIHLLCRESFIIHNS